MGEDGTKVIKLTLRGMFMLMQFDLKTHVAVFTSTQISDHRIFLQTICWHEIEAK